LHAEAKKSMETKLDFITQRAAEEPKERFSNLMHHISKDSLRANFSKLGRNRAVGVDGVSWQEYNREIDANIEALLGRMKRMGYRPQAVRRVYIPKDKGKNQTIRTSGN